MYPQQYEPPKIAPIVHPDVPGWMLTMSSTRPEEWSGDNAKLLAPVLVPVGFLGLLAVDGAFAVGVIGALVSTIGLLVAGIAGALGLRGRMVAAPRYTYEGVRIEGEALDLLADIQHRFAWAEKMFDEVPTGIRWDEVEHQVRVLLWEAAGHAAKVSAIDHESQGLGYANPGTPQAALRDDLQRRRAAYWTMLTETQREADDLAREASNTAAAARLALRTGTLADLELLTPSGANLVARGTLAAARARLHLLAEVWAELDETGTARRTLEP